MPQIVPAVLSNDLADYKNKISVFEKLAPRVQVDIIDGKFADNLTVGAKEIEAVKTPLFLETQLMVNDPKIYIDGLANAGVKLITFHFESFKNSEEVFNIIDKIKSLEIQVGIAINPETPVENIEKFIERVDLVLVMSVHPGFGGQKFIPESLNKIKLIRKKFPRVKIEIDGGVNLENAEEIISAGADYIVTGSGLLKNGINKEAVKGLLGEFNKKIRLGN